MHLVLACLNYFQLKRQSPRQLLSDRNFVLRNPCELWQRSKRCFKTNTDLLSHRNSLRHCLYKGKNVSQQSYRAHLQH